MLKIIKINVPVTVKADADDSDDIREKLYEHLQIGMEEQELEFVVEEDNEDEELED